MKRPFDVDLHMHTYYSDGRASPRQLLEHAASLGLRTVAVTDHDNARGAKEATPIAQELGLELIPAIEFSGYWNGYTGHGGGPDIDILGYFLDFGNAALQAFEARLMQGIQARAVGCCAYLTRAGLALEMSEVDAVNPRYPGFLQLVFALKAKHGISTQLAHEQVDKAWKYVGMREAHLSEIIEVIHQAGGVAVLAHPSIVRQNGKALQADGMAELVEMGLDGVEIYHYRLDAPLRKHFLKLAERLELLITGGSDEHGWPEGFPRMGSEPVTNEMVEALAVRR